MIARATDRSGNPQGLQRRAGSVNKGSSNPPNQFEAPLSAILSKPVSIFFNLQTAFHPIPSFFWFFEGKKMCEAGEDGDIGLGMFFG